MLPFVRTNNKLADCNQLLQSCNIDSAILQFRLNKPNLVWTQWSYKLFLCRSTCASSSSTQKIAWHSWVKCSPRSQRRGRPTGKSLTAKPTSGCASTTSDPRTTEDSIPIPSSCPFLSGTRRALMRLRWWLRGGTVWRLGGGGRGLRSCSFTMLKGELHYMS